MLEDDVRAPFELLDALGAHDMAMLFQPDPRQRLVGEAGHGVLVGQEAALERLDGDRFPVLVVVTQIDDAHPAAQHLRHLVAPVDPVAVGEFAIFGPAHEPVQQRERRGGVALRRALSRLDFQHEHVRLVRARLAELGGRFDREEAGPHVGAFVAVRHDLVRVDLGHVFRLRRRGAIGRGGHILGLRRRHIPQCQQLGLVAQPVQRAVLLDFGHRPQRHGNIAPRGYGARHAHHPAHKGLVGTLGQLAVVRIGPGQLHRLAIGVQHLADVKHAQPPIVLRQRQARAQIPQRQIVVGVHHIPAQGQPAQPPDLFVRIAGERVALVGLAPPVEQALLLIGRQRQRVHANLRNGRKLVRGHVSLSSVTELRCGQGTRRVHAGPIPTQSR